MAQQFPVDVKYTKDHEWARKEGAHIRIGISQHAIDQLGDITLVNFEAKVGATLEAGKAIGTVESVKAVSDVYAPIAGKVVEVNTALNDKPEILNEDPYGKGWMVLIESTGPEPELMDSTAYASFVATLDH
ncbi:MAG: glycine cleavage system protein GcvH, partial [Deltaproteobacteria bacterium]